jgi:PAN domain
MSFPASKFFVRNALLLASIAVIALGVVMPKPATADIRRSCNATLHINGPANDLDYPFRIYVSVANTLYANQARRRSRDAIISCVQGHWNMRLSNGRPHWCSPEDGYPFQSFNEEMTDAICAANPGRQSFLVDVSVAISGDTGCVPNNQWAPISIARDYRVYCWIPPAPEVREGWNLPRQDYRWWEMARNETWQDCAKTCADESRCQAWTYKHPTGGDPPLCFLKDGVPGWSRDGRFVSGIKGEVLH